MAALVPSIGSANMPALGHGLHPRSALLSRKTLVDREAPREEKTGFMEENRGDILPGQNVVLFLWSNN
jgi:hypothetical protein